VHTVGLLSLLLLGSVLPTVSGQPTPLRLNLAEGDEYRYSVRTAIIREYEDGTDSNDTRVISSTIRLKSKLGDKYVLEISDMHNDRFFAAQDTRIQLTITCQGKTVAAEDLNRRGQTTSASTNKWPFVFPEKPITVGERWVQIEPGDPKSGIRERRINYEVVERTKQLGHDVYFVNFYSDPANESILISGSVSFDVTSGMMVSLIINSEYPSSLGTIKMFSKAELSKVKRGR